MEEVTILRHIDRSFDVRYRVRYLWITNLAKEHIHVPSILLYLLVDSGWLHRLKPADPSVFSVLPLRL